MWSKRPKAHPISLQIIPFFSKNYCFSDWNRKQEKESIFFLFQLPHPHICIQNNVVTFIPFSLISATFFFLPSKKNLFFYFSRRDFFVEMWKIDVLICTWIVWSGWSYLFLDNGFLYFGFREDQISGFVCVDVWRLPLSLWSLRYDWFSLVNEISSLICVMS